jgi:hypothetical protein
VQGDVPVARRNIPAVCRSGSKVESHKRAACFTDLLRCVSILSKSLGVTAMVRLGLRAALAGLLALPAAAGASELKTLYQFTQPFGSLGEFTVAKSGLMYGTSTGFDPSLPP